MLRLILTGAVTFALGIAPGTISPPSALHIGNPATAATARPSYTKPVKTPPALLAFAHAWKMVKGYNATITIFEQQGARTQSMAFDYHFTKPSSVAVRVVAGANTGARLVWEGGSTVLVRRGGGLLSMLKKTVPLHDPLVTTIRGSSIDQLSFASILAHDQQPGILSEKRGEVVDGVTTDAVTLIPTHASANANFTREVMEISSKTHFPMRVVGYEGLLIARKIEFSNVRLAY
jgi:hypothetical protein